MEKGGAIAMYYGTEMGEIVAVSGDPLWLNWEKVAGQPVIPISSRDGAELPYRVHDPCVWHQGDCYYRLYNGKDP